MRGDKATFFKIVKGFILVKSSIKYLETSKAEIFCDEDNYQALDEFMKLSESELHILKYFLKLIKLKNS